LDEAILVRLIVPVMRYILSAFSQILKANKISICFVDHDPPGSMEIDRWDFHPIPLGRSEHWVKIVTAEGLQVSDINMRFLSKEEADATPGNAPPTITSIIQIEDITVIPEIEAQGHKPTRTKDRHGGIDLKIWPAYAWGTGRAIFLKLTVEARQSWSGKISFRCYDKDYHSRYARADVRVLGI
jgi:hypothetical protein